MPGGRIDIEIAPDLRAFPGKLSAGLKSSTGIAAAAGKGLGLAIAGGATVAAVGLKQILELGNQYASQMNTLQSVTQATGVEMASVGNLAKELGADLTLPATSAADAAAAMTELAKGGLDVHEAMTAAKGTLQLAAAAQVGAAQAAEIQSDALNQFGLAADQASRVADVLANTANAASGEITDVANALKFVGPVAKTVNEPIENVATAIGLIATQGIRGEQAGTSLRGMIASLAAPSGPAAKALTELGIKAFDATGKFVGLRSITEQLAKAKGRMTEAAFTEAAAVAFGNEGMTVASALASTGAKAFDDMAVSVTRAGGAADVAAAKTKGLGGAWEGLKSQLETTGIGIFEAIDGPLENAVRAASDHIAQWDDTVVSGIETAVAAGELFGPRLADAIGDRAGVVQNALADVFGPLASGASGPLNEALNTGIEGFEDLTDVLDNTVSAAKPVAEAIGAVGAASADGDGAVSAFGAGIGLATDALRLASAVLLPVGNLIGGLVEGFSELPGPVQSAVIALVAYRVAQRALGDTTALTGIRQFAGEMRVQQGLASANGQEVGKLAAAMAAYRTSTVPAVAAARSFTDQTAAIRAGAAAAGQPIGVMSAAIGTLVERSPALSSMRTAFDNAAGGASRFGTAAGIAAAAGTGLKTAAGGLVSALGGPFGLAVAGAGIGLSLLAKSQQEAAQKASDHKRELNDLQASLDQTSGAMTRQARENRANANATDGVNAAATRQKIALDDLLDAQTGSASALAKVNQELRTGARSFVESNEAAVGLEKTLRSAGISFGDLTEVAVGNQGALAKVKDAIAGVQSTAQREGLADLLKDLQGASGDFSKLGGSLGSTNDKLKDAVKNILEARKALGDSSPFTARLAAGIDVLGSSASSAADRVRYLKDAMDIFSGGEIALTAAQASFNRTLQAANDSLGAGADKAKGWGDEIINASGKLSVATKNGQDFQRTADGLTTDLLNVATATFDVSKAAGDTLPVSFDKVRASVQSSRDKLIDLAVNGYGASREAANKYADQLGLIPSVVATKVTTGGTAPAVQEEVSKVLSGLHGLPPDTPVKVSALTEEAKRLLLDLGFRIESIEDGKFAVYADTSPGQSAVDKFIRDNNGKTIGIRVNVGGIDGVRIGGPNVASHDGNLVQAFAQGGFHRQLKPMKAGLATIVPPNTWRVVGDRLRDDEAYIPINRTSRSVSLLVETAQRMGYAVMRRYAQGGIASNGGAATSAAPSLVGLEISGRLRNDGDGFMTLVDGRIENAMHKAGTAYANRRGF